MQLILKQNQIFTTVSIAYQGMTTDISKVLIDTGSATSILAVDAVASISIEPVLEDIFHTILLIYKRYSFVQNDMIK